MFRFNFPYLGNNSGRGPSGFWSNCPDNIANPNIGIADGDDFDKVGDYPSTSGAAYAGATTGPWCGYSTYGYQGSTVVDAGIQGAGITVGSDGDNEMGSISRFTAGHKLNVANKKLWFECRIKSSTITDTKHNLFIGLMEPLAATTGTPISTSDALVDKNILGFWRCADATSGNGPLVRAVYKNSGQTAQMLTTSGPATLDLANVTTSVAATLAAATWVKLGFTYDPDAPASKQMQFYVNGVAWNGAFVTATNMAAAAFPNDTYMSFCFGVMNATGSTPGTSSIDWWACAQLI